MRCRIAIFLFSQLWAIAVRAQSSSEQVWAEYMLNFPFANTWNIEFATAYSTVLDVPKWRSLDFQITPELALGPRVDVMAAVFGGITYQSQVVSTSEIREMIGARFHFTPNRRMLTRLLGRAEQRNQQVEETNVWEHSTRLRFRAETLTPINKKSMYEDDLLYLIFDAEAFVVLDQDVNERFANRFRLRAGFGYRLNYSARFEFLYTLQQSRNTITDDFSTVDNIFRIRFKQFLNKSKPSKAAGLGN